MAAAVSIRHTIARIYTLRNDTENARAWMLKAIDVQSHLKKEMWSERQCFCYDIDYRRRNIDTLAEWIMNDALFDVPRRRVSAGEAAHA
jgi:neutral trehalase